MFEAISGRSVGWKASGGCGLSAIVIAKKLIFDLSHRINNVSHSIHKYLIFKYFITVL